ncbi:MAG: glutathione S-transferase N-terminal domain-containing protein [Pseudomonadota bacterium]
METYQLFHFDFCPFCIRVRAFLDQVGLEIPLRNIHQDPQAHQELLAGGGSTQVPCLRIEQAGEVRWLYESADIIAYFGEQLGQQQARQ